MLDPVGAEGYTEFVRIGAGGFSTVYRAQQERFNRSVAIKVLNTELHDPDARRRFFRECRIAGVLSSHPNCVTVLDAGLTEQAQPYIVFEHMGGGSLATRVAQAPLPVDAVLRIGVKLSAAMVMVHGEGILHRDLKPHNILLSDFGEPCLTDFGISAMTIGTDAASMTNSITPLYTAPEVLDGGPSTEASDVYSLGGTLYTLLAGRAPHQAESTEGMRATLNRIFNDPPPALSRTDIPVGLRTTLEQALQRDPQDRIPTMLALGHALQAAQESIGQRPDQMVLTRRLSEEAATESEPKSELTVRRSPVPSLPATAAPTPVPSPYAETSDERYDPDADLPVTVVHRPSKTTPHFPDDGCLAGPNSPRRNHAKVYVFAGTSMAVLAAILAVVLSAHPAGTVHRRSTDIDSQSLAQPDQSTFDPSSSSTALASASATVTEVAGGIVHTWSSYATAGGAAGAQISALQAVEVTCRIPGFKVQDGDGWWYRLESAPWNSQFYGSADAFYNNGKTSGSLLGTPAFDPRVPICTDRGPWRGGVG